jgi:hypothetical protein
MESFKIPLSRVIFDRGCCGTLENYSLGSHFTVKYLTAAYYRGFSREYSAALFRECASCNNRTNMDIK